MQEEFNKTALYLFASYRQDVSAITSGSQAVARTSPLPLPGRRSAPKLNQTLGNTLCLGQTCPAHVQNQGDAWLARDGACLKRGFGARVVRQLRGSAAAGRVGGGPPPGGSRPAAGAQDRAS